MRTVWAVFLLSVLLPSAAFGLDFLKTGATHPNVSVTSASAAVQICAVIDNTCQVQVPPGAAVPVWFVQVDVGTACSTVTAVAGLRLAASAGYKFSPREDGWIGQICAILESGVTAVSVAVTKW